MRQRFHDAGVYVVSLVSSRDRERPCSWRKLLSLYAIAGNGSARWWAIWPPTTMRPDWRAAALPVRQITTGTVCHLEAEMVEKALDGWNLGELDFLFVENVGNLVCPACYDLGEDLRLVLFGDRGGGQAAEISDDLQHRRSGDDHQDRAGGCGRIIAGRLPQHPRRPARVWKSSKSRPRLGQGMEA